MKVDKVVFVVNVRREISAAAEPSSLRSVRVLDLKVSDEKAMREELLRGGDWS